MPRVSGVILRKAGFGGNTRQKAYGRRELSEVLIPRQERALKRERHRWR
jgi:hypothetical protein